jgi:hypothetical protein
MGHIYGSIPDTMKIMKIEKNGKHLNMLEKYHIYKVTKNRLQMNDAHIDVCNPIFEALQELNSRELHIHNIKTDSIQLSKHSQSRHTTQQEETPSTIK